MSMKNLKELEGKTIKTIEHPDELEFNGEIFYDDNILITFTDGTILKLCSWDAEDWISGIYKEIIN